MYVCNNKKYVGIMYNMQYAISLFYKLARYYTIDRICFIR